MKKMIVVLLFVGLLQSIWMQLSPGGRLQAQNVMGGAVGDPSALLDLQSETRGLLIPRMTSAERSAITNPAAGLMIYNTSLQCVELNIGSSSPDWICLTGTGICSALDCGSAVITDPLLAGVSNNRRVTIAYSGGNGGLHNGQVIASTGVTGLTASLQPGAFANGGGSLTYVITGIPAETGVASFELSLGGQSCTLEWSVESCGAFVATDVWKEFMCHNLGADLSADPLTPSWELIGNYYQWGRNPTCFGRDDIDAPNPCTGPVYGVAGPWGGTVATDNAGAINGWNYIVAPNGAWQDDVKTINDPCPEGFRVPTLADWQGVVETSANTRKYVGTWTYYDITDYSSGLKIGRTLLLPAAGDRYSEDGSLDDNRYYFGNYWSSTESGSGQAHYLRFQLYSFTVVTDFYRDFGNSVRCVKE